MMDQSREPLPEHRFDLQELLRELAEQASRGTSGCSRDESLAPPMPDQGPAFGATRAVQDNGRD
ncbi:hypothetical protein HGR_09433 [Hylemonella gracilis ATCC 19624]|uniref:Uncharacterized protein n=1 Tax=Hylemonella gracilis ATCC 19624 TaxID=887062 RepID=F3KTV5_9BURK|nr:hypothetical protein HGR_09433 [Hylemonella gracilis ATCC 19624]